MGLKSNFHAYFPDPDPHMEWVRNPFATYGIKLSSGKEDSLIGLKSDVTLKSEFLVACPFGIPNPNRHSCKITDAFRNGLLLRGWVF
jgi:hypothetical protein